MIGADIIALLDSRLNDGKPDDEKVIVRPIRTDYKDTDYGVIAVRATVVDTVIQWGGRRSNVYEGNIGVAISARDYDRAEEIGMAVRGILHQFAGYLGSRYHVLSIQTDPESLARDDEESVDMVIQGYSALWRVIGD